MPESFRSFQAFADRLGAVAAYLPPEVDRILETVGQKLEGVARAKFGVYQPGAGPMPAWADLSPRTMLERAKLGFTPNDPLLRSGATRDTTGHGVDHGVLTLGSTSQIMPELEFGDRRRNVPPRPVYGPTMYENASYATRQLMLAVQSAFFES
ncbi:hypothetical protein VPG91_11440 [Nitrospirillum amazonense]|uniref:hypothetical protein n=1 Tax=Nitrospirillum amazonense TaxID=28077 RepID=UPI002DD44734|nr:hypothetical protein [Nitrospirillum amazonense]MEC4591602.1 hypothetical protein [Nitrospirillum amazonense]